MATKKYLSYDGLQEYDDLIKAYADNAATTVKNDILNGAGEAYDTLKELGDLIDDNVDAIDALEIVATSKASAADLTSHIDNKSNPHEVTKEQIGLDNVDNTSDMDKPVSTAQSGAINIAKKAGDDAQTRADAAYSLAESKQPKITGTAGQFVVIGDDGNVTTKTVPYAEEASF